LTIRMFMVLRGLLLVHFAYKTCESMQNRGRAVTPAWHAHCIQNGGKHGSHQVVA